MFLHWFIHRSCTVTKHCMPGKGALGTDRALIAPTQTRLAILTWVTGARGVICVLTRMILWLWI